jgi:hypothetical protein
MCSGSLIYLLDLLLGEVMEEVMGGLVDCQNSFWTFTRFGRKVAGSNSTSLFPELTLEELLYYSCAMNTTLSFCCNRKLVCKSAVCIEEDDKFAFNPA